MNGITTPRTERLKTQSRSSGARAPGRRRSDPASTRPGSGSLDPAGQETPRAEAPYLQPSFSTSPSRQLSRNPPGKRSQSPEGHDPSLALSARALIERASHRSSVSPELTEASDPLIAAGFNPESPNVGGGRAEAPAGRTSVNVSTRRLRLELDTWLTCRAAAHAPPGHGVVPAVAWRTPSIARFRPCADEPARSAGRRAREHVSPERHGDPFPEWPPARASGAGPRAG
jgi:hypothetical protein